MDENQLIQAFIQAEAAGDEQAMDSIADQFAALEESSKPSIVGGTTRAAVQGASFGWGDEIEAWARSLVEDASYEEIRDDIRDYNERFREEHPALSYGAEFGAGFLVPGGVAGKALQYGSRAARAGKAIGAGAGIGAVSGAGTSEADQALDVLADATLGAGAGALFGGLGGAAEAALANKATSTAAGAVRTGLGGKTIQEVTDTMRKYPGGTITEAAGDTMQQVANQAQMSGAANRDKYIGFLTDRMSGQTKRIRSIMQDETGIDPLKTRRTAQEALEGVRDREARALYGPVREAAQTEPVNVSMGMRMMLKQDPDMKGAADDALLSMQRRAAREGRQDAYDMTIGDVEDSFEFWHELQSTLRERASQLGTPTRTGTSRRAGGMVGSLRDDLMGELTDPRRHSWGPAYEKATLKYRQSSEVIEALKDSAEFAKTDPADLRKIMSGLSDEERTAFATGTVADLLYKVAGQSDTSNQARSLMKSTRLKENLAVLLGEGPAAKLIDRLEDEAKKLDTYKKVTGNSATSIRQAMSEVLGENPGAEFVNEVLQGNMLGAAKAGVSSIMPNNAGTKTMDPRAAESILDMMMITDPMKLNRAMAELESQRQGLTSAGARILPGLMGGLGSTTQQEY